jgi:hypothetical protein
VIEGEGEGGLRGEADRIILGEGPAEARGGHGEQVPARQLYVEIESHAGEVSHLRGGVRVVRVKRVKRRVRGL